MPYDEEIEARIHKTISRWKDTEAKKMFGGTCHLLSGNMFCGVYKDFLILRLGEEESKEALKSSSVRPFDITGKPMKGWVMVEKAGFKSDEALKAWLAKAKGFVSTLPSKG
jgi:TfoX/Sxy family transcriptional regulator of competence genes